jgi:hypothetical protein
MQTTTLRLLTPMVSALGQESDLMKTSATYVAWTWDAGSSTVTNTEGSITSQVRANASAGFSVVTYTGTGSAATVGHGFGCCSANDDCKIKIRDGIMVCVSPSNRQHKISCSSNHRCHANILSRVE